jgi:hypothetical protein
MSVEFYYGLHKLEFERSDKHDARSDSLIALFTTLCGFFGFLVLGFKSRQIEITYAFWILSLLAVAALAIAIGYLISAYLVPRLREIESASKWRDYRDELDAEYRAAPGKFATAQEEFDDGLERTSIDATDANVDLNIKRSAHLRTCTLGLFAAFLLLAGASTGYYYATQERTASQRTQEVTQMLSMKDSLVCVPAEETNTATRPGTRPVPGPTPGPRPPPKH